MDTDDLEYSEFKHDFRYLPLEIITKIFEYLDYTDRNYASITCTQWMAASENAKFQSKKILIFKEVSLTDKESPISFFLQSVRIFPNVHLLRADIWSMNKYWTQFGKNIQEIVFESLDLTDKQFTSIVKELKNLKSITIEDCPGIFMSGQILSSTSDRCDVSESFSKIKQLSFKNNAYLSDLIISRFSSLINGLELLDLTKCQIAFHNALQNRFYPNGDVNEPSESILTLKYILKVINDHAITFKVLNLSRTLIGQDGLEQIISMDHLALQNFILTSCFNIKRMNIDVFMSKSEIQYIDLSNCTFIKDESLISIANTCKNLEMLNVSLCKNITENGVIALNVLRKLKSVNISGCDKVESNAILYGIARKENINLLELYMKGLHISEESLLKCCQNLPNLLVLDVSLCTIAVTDTSVRAIIENLVKLRTLSVDFSYKITDSTITGIDDCNFSMNKLFEEKSSHIEKISDNPVRKSISRIKGLKTLSLYGCNKISDISLSYALIFNELRALSLCECNKITFTGIKSLVVNCPAIEILFISECNDIDDRSIDMIAKCLHRLKYLNMSYCKKLTNLALDSLADNCKVLKKVSVYGCPLITMDPLVRLSKFPGISTLTTSCILSLFN